MAGAFITGAKRDITITKKPIANNPAYPPSGGPKPKIQKKSEAKITNPTIPPGVIKIGLRVKQTETVETFKLLGRNGQQLPLSALPAGNPVEADLAAALGIAADEKWVTFRSNVNYNPATFGRTFDTELVLNPFDCHVNGVRVLTVAATFDALSFANDHYVYGVSILPGQNSKGFSIDVRATAPKKKTAKKAPKRRSKR